MDGMLSQEEINALLSGMDISEGSGGGNDAAAAPSGSSGGGGSEIDQSLLSDMEKDAIGEIANISMGTSATTLFSLLNQKVDITTPKVSLANWETVLEEYPAPCVFVEIQYTIGLEGSNIMILEEKDVKVITNLMMGGDGTDTSGELGELHLSAISEAMNQMMGSSATSLSSMMGKKIDISPPKATLVKINDLVDSGRASSFMDSTFVKIEFRMQVGELIDSTIMQLYPLDFAKSLYDIFMGNQFGTSSPEPASAPAPAPSPAPAPAPSPAPAPAAPADPYGGQMPPYPYPYPPQQMMMQQMPMPQTNVAPAQFQMFTPEMMVQIGKENLGLITDVPLEVTVELGRTTKTIQEILDFAPGTIIELEKIAGEPIDILVNGKFVAKGEVVVIEESFGVRITEIIKE